MWRLPRLTYSTAFKTSVVFALILSSSVALMGGFVFWSTVGFMDRQTNAVIETDIEALAEVYQRDGLRGLITTIEARVERDPVRSSIYLVADANSVPVVGNISAWPKAVADEAGWLEFVLTDRSTGEKTRARSRPFLLRGGINLLVGRDIRSLQETKRLIERALISGMGITIVGGISAGWLLSGRLRRRLRHIVITSRDVMRGNLSRRVPDFGKDDDLDEVARSLNAMLDEIQALLSGIEHVADNIAHDLRTPLARLRNRLASLRETVAADGRVATATDECIGEVDQLLATFAALLRIAKLEAAGSSRHLTTVALDEVLAAAIDLYAPLAEENGIALSVEAAPVTVHGERDLLLQAVCNVLDNAVKFSPPQGRIAISLRAADGLVKLSIEDHGDGIHALDRTRLFERFYRGKNAANTEGSGLGLSLVRAICLYHNAEIDLYDAAPGLRVAITFKASDQCATPPGPHTTGQ